MGQIKYYMIVTNDASETPVAIDLRGAKQVAEYLGVTVQNVRHRLMRGQWRGKYKAVPCGVVEKYDEKAYQKRYRMRRILQECNYGEQTTYSVR